LLITQRREFLQQCGFAHAARPKDIEQIKWKFRSGDRSLKCRTFGFSTDKVAATRHAQMICQT